MRKITHFLFSRTLIVIALAFYLGTNSYAQFAGPVGHLSSAAMHKDSSSFVAWATNCLVSRGLLDISNPSLGYATAGLEVYATGAADESGTVSLGDRGYAIVTFESPIFNGPGPDFAVFENAFNDSFLELGMVEVSSNGIDFFRFPATSFLPFASQIGPFDELGEASKLNNLAGKYRVGYSTPFDLEELAGISALNVNAISHVKIIDVVGSIDSLYASFDIFQHPINDPYPTPFPSGGFDLDAVGVIHQLGVNNLTLLEYDDLKTFPNPTLDILQVVATNQNISSLSVYDLSGKEVMVSFTSTFSIEHLKSGMYQLEILLDNGFKTTRRIQKL